MTKNTYWNEGETTSGRIDHAAESRKMLNLVPASMHTDEVFAVAQVHATLALVEQQRIGNILAVAVMNHGNSDIVNRKGVMQEIAKTLGLE